MSQPVPGRPPPVIAAIVATGFTALLFGTLIAAFSPGGRTPGLVIVSIGILLTVPGLVLLRRARERALYRVTKRWSARLVLGALAAGAVVIGASILAVMLLDKTIGVRVPGAVLFIPGLVFVLKIYLGQRTALLINPSGIQLGGVMTVWPIVDRLVLSRDDPGVTEVRVQLRPGAESDQNDPAHVAVPTRKLVASDLLDAVERFGPGGVQVVEQIGSAQRMLSR